MRLLANENFPLSSVQLLKDSGFDVLCVGRDYAGILDTEVLELADTEKRTILTFDKDYGELIFKKGFRPDAGVIIFRWDNFQPDDPGRYLAELIKAGDLKLSNSLTVITESNIRQRKY